MKLYLLTAIIFLLGIPAIAQEYRKVIHAGESLSDHFTYRFPAFEEATVLFKNGGTLKSKMNFNMLLCSMQFIDPKGDTLEVAKPELIDSLLFANNTFFLKEGYVEIIALAKSVKLVVCRTAKSESVVLGPMGAPSRNVSTESFNSYKYRFSVPISLQVNEDIYLYNKTEYFLVTDADKFIKASKNNFLKTFDKNRKNIEEFLKLNKTNFNKQDDLKQLFHYCVTIN